MGDKFNLPKETRQILLVLDDLVNNFNSKYKQEEIYSDAKPLKKKYSID
jgi:hypothetical protein